MKAKIITISIILLLLVGCKKKTFDEFDFSFGNTFETNFSIKFNYSNDSVYIRQNWSANDINDKIKAPKSETNYISIINNEQRKKLDSFVSHINFKKFDTIYHESYADGESYKFHIKQNGIEKTIGIHSHNIPKELENFAYWIYETKKSLKLTETSENFDFKSKFIYPKPPTLKGN